MGSRRSRRERLFKVARELGLRPPQDISDDSLKNLIDAQPATGAQREKLQGFLGPGVKLPPDLTYGRANESIALAYAHANVVAIERLKLEAGTLLRTPRGTLVQVSNINVRRNNIVWLQPVEVRDGKVRIIADSKQYVVNPHDMLFTYLVVRDIADLYPGVGEEEDGF